MLQKYVYILIAPEFLDWKKPQSMQSCGENKYIIEIMNNIWRKIVHCERNITALLHFNPLNQWGGGGGVEHPLVYLSSYAS